MAQRRFHYERAFEHYLRANRVPYIAVDEARKALLPTDRAGGGVSGGSECGGAIKSFDFVVYAPHRNLLVDVKGRMYGPPRTGSHNGRGSARRTTAPGSVGRRGCGGRGGRGGRGGPRFESWVTMDDVEGMKRWQELFGRDFEAAFVFVYCLRQQPPDALFEEVFEWPACGAGYAGAGGGAGGGARGGGGRWYALREVRLEDYMREMTPRSGKWRTVHVLADAFLRISRPFSAREGACHAGSCGRTSAALF